MDNFINESDEDSLLSSKQRKKVAKQMKKQINRAIRDVAKQTMTNERFEAKIEKQKKKAKYYKEKRKFALNFAKQNNLNDCAENGKMVDAQKEQPQQLDNKNKAIKEREKRIKKQN